LRIVDRRARIVGRERPTNRDPSIITATHHRRTPIVWLLQHSDESPAANRSGGPLATVIDHLSADSTRRHQPTDQRTIVSEPRLNRPIAIAAMQRLTLNIADVMRDHNPSVVQAYDALPARQLDQDRRHQPILIERST
jgi:hypothetical protein